MEEQMATLSEHNKSIDAVNTFGLNEGPETIPQWKTLDTDISSHFTFIEEPTLSAYDI